MLPLGVVPGMVCQDHGPYNFERSWSISRSERYASRNGLLVVRNTDGGNPSAKALDKVLRMAGRSPWPT